MLTNGLRMNTTRITTLTIFLLTLGVSALAQDRRTPPREPAQSHSAPSSESVADRPTMGVLEARFIGQKDDAVLRDLFTTAVRGRVVKLVSDSVDVIEGSKLDKLMLVNAASCSNASCLAQFAKKAGVDYLLETKLTVHKGKWTANLKLAYARDESVRGEELQTFASEDAAQAGIGTLAEKVVKGLVKGGKSVDPGTETGGEETVIAPPPAGATKVVVKFGSVPEGASVNLDGKLLCQTPKEKTVLQGEHWIEMGKDGYRSKREKVNVTRNGQELSWSLSPIQTRLNLDAVDDRTGNDLIADVYVDGAKMGQTPFDGLVAVGSGRIEVAPEGFDRKTVSVTLEEGKTASATAHFRSVMKIGEAREASWVTEFENKLLHNGVVTLDAVYFENGKATISRNSGPYLEMVGKILTKYPKFKLEVGGHVDNTGSKASGLKLSAGRSDAVKTFLSNAFPELARSLSAKGYGADRPKASNKTADGRIQNRRIEIKVLDPSELKNYTTH